MGYYISSSRVLNVQNNWAAMRRMSESESECFKWVQTLSIEEIERLMGEYMKGLPVVYFSILAEDIFKKLKSNPINQEANPKN